MKTKTEQIEAAFQDVLTGGRDPSLNEIEQKLFDTLASEFRAGNFEAEGEAWRLDFYKEPPSMETFLMDDYYLGATWRPVHNENEGIWPEWLNLLAQHLNYDSRIHNMVITGSLGIGKCHRRGDKVMRSDTSLCAVEDLKVGDTLMGDDGQPRTIQSLAKGRDLIFEIKDDCGESFFVNKQHILCLNFGCNEDVVEMPVNQFQKLPATLRHQARLYTVGIELPAKPVRLDPYWLGLWLGDGASRGPHITTADAVVAGYHAHYASQFGLSIREDTDLRGNAAKTYCAHTTYSRRKRRMSGNPLTNLLRSYKLASRQNGFDKFIPSDYLHNSTEVRRALLAGLIDADGSLSSAGHYEITSKHEHLAGQIQWLARSLGFKATISLKIVNATAYWRVSICGADNLPVRLPHKQSTARTAKSYHRQRKFAVIPRKEDDYFGFTLDGNGRYLLPNFTVTHNTVMMVTVILYRICLACHLKNPQHFFGLNRNSNIVYNFLSVTKEAVKDTAFGNAMSFMADSAFFKEVCKFDPESDYSEYRIEMANTLPDGRPSRIWLSGGSKGQHVLGRNLIGIGLDEGNFRLEKDPDLKAYELYDQVRTRIANRFQKIASYLPAISIIASSAQDESSFTEKVCQEIEEHNRLRQAENATITIEENKLPVTQLVIRNAVYKIKRHALTGIGPDHHWFKVAYGLKNMEPFILSGWYREDGTPVETEEIHEEPPSGAKTELVPKFYWEAYRRNCKAQLQNLSGISVGGAHRLFPSLLDIEQCLSASQQEHVPDPMLPGVQRIPVSAEDSKNIWDFLNHKTFLTRVASRIQPIRHPQYKRYAHIDLATQTLAGVSICHLAGSQLIEGLVKDGQPFSEYRLVVEYDFILTICAGQNKPINLEKIQRFFFWLRDMCGFQFGLITADMFQCLTRDTLVDTDHGLLPISKVKPGYRVQDVNGKQAKVIKNFCYRQVPVLRITTDHNEVICGTPNHRLRAADNCIRPHTHARFYWKQLSDLKPGDILDMVSAPVCVQGRKQEAKATWLGLYWGDGCLKTGKDTGTISITCEKTHVNEAVALCEQAFGLRAKVYWSENGQSAEVAVHSRKWLRWMLRNGYQKHPKKSTKTGQPVELPEPILRANRKTQAAFLRGLFSADGSVDNLGTVSLSTKHSGLARQVAVLLRTQFGLRSNLVRSYRLGFGKRRVQWTVQVGGSRQTFYDQIGFCFSAKQCKLTEHLDKKGRRLVSRVRHVEQDVSDVYDLTVEGTHSYTANGFISHNSEMPLQTLEARGFEVDKLSVDRDKSVYTAWRTGFEEHRIRLHRNEQMMREAEQLLEMDKKYDHPPDGSKDTTDSAAGAYFNAINSDEKLMLSSHNHPSVYSGQALARQDNEKAPVEIVLPERGYTRSKVFEA